MVGGKPVVFKCEIRGRAADVILAPDAAEPQPKGLSRLAASGQQSAISGQHRKIVYFLHSISRIRD